MLNDSLGGTRGIENIPIEIGGEEPYPRPVVDATARLIPIAFPNSIDVD